MKFKIELPYVELAEYGYFEHFSIRDINPVRRGVILQVAQLSGQSGFADFVNSIQESERMVTTNLNPQLPKLGITPGKLSSKLALGYASGGHIGAVHVLLEHGEDKLIAIKGYVQNKDIKEVEKLAIDDVSIEFAITCYKKTFFFSSHFCALQLLTSTNNDKLYSELILAFKQGQTNFDTSHIEEQAKCIRTILQKQIGMGFTQAYQRILSMVNSKDFGIKTEATKSLSDTSSNIDASASSLGSTSETKKSVSYGNLRLFSQLDSASASSSSLSQISEKDNTIFNSNT